MIIMMIIIINIISITCLYTYTHIYIRIYIYICMYMCIYIICAYVYVCVCVCIYIYIHMYIYIYIYTYYHQSSPGDTSQKCRRFPKSTNHGKTRTGCHKERAVCHSYLSSSFRQAVPPKLFVGVSFQGPKVLAR